jgi:hypothetical protein
MRAIYPGLLEGGMTDDAVNLTVPALRLSWCLYKGEANQGKREGENHPQKQPSQPSDHLHLSLITYQTGLGIGAA